MNWILVIVLALIFFLALRGAYRGFLRIVFSLVALILVIVVAAAAAPHISSFLTNHTGIYAAIEERCVERVDSYLSSDQLETNISETLQEIEGEDADAEDASDTEESSSLLTGDWMLPSLIEDYLVGAVASGDADAEDAESTDAASDTAAAAEDETTEVTDEVLASVSEQLTDMTGQVREETAQIIGAKIASIILTVISYILALIVAIIVVKIISFVIGLIGRIPIIGGINRFIGLFAGAFEGLLVSWILLLLLSVVAGTEAGSPISSMIAGNAFLTYLYDNNLVLSILNQFLSL